MVYYENPVNTGSLPAHETVRLQVTRSYHMANEGSFEASLKRSNQIKEDLALHPENYRMLTGDRPTGRLHLGHYFGTIRERRRANEQDLDYIKDVIHEGNKRANEIADATLDEVRAAMGMVY